MKELAISYLYLIISLVIIFIMYAISYYYKVRKVSNAIYYCYSKDVETYIFNLFINEIAEAEEKGIDCPFEASYITKYSEIISRAYKSYISEFFVYWMHGSAKSSSSLLHISKKFYNSKIEDGIFYITMKWFFDSKYMSYEEVVFYKYDDKLKSIISEKTTELLNNGNKHN